jgi:hypothetical protein
VFLLQLLPPLGHGFLVTLRHILPLCFEIRISELGGIFLAFLGFALFFNKEVVGSSRGSRGNAVGTAPTASLTAGGLLRGTCIG